MKYERTNYPYSEWAKGFFEYVKKHGEHNSKFYYRFRMYELWNYLLREDIEYYLRGAVYASMMYHLKKIGFKKTEYPNEYGVAKSV